MLDKILKFLKAAENRETFFRRIAVYYPKSDMRYREIERAYNLVKDEFRGKTREGGGRYFEHIRAAALILIEYLRVKDYRLIIAILLHDLVEDIPAWTIERVRQEFGDYIAMLVDYMTKPSKKEYPDKRERERVYHTRFRFAPREFFMLKLPDRLHNVITLPGCAKEKRLRKIAETREHYLPYAEEQMILLHELEEALEIAEKAA
ncbi:MAG: HD domain-containing protein [Patescibacteria group bacterium]